MQRERAFSDGDLAQLANLCHNRRGSCFACQYAAPHAFDLNLPRALSDLQQNSWKARSWPAGLARAFDRSGVVMAALFVAGSGD